MGIPRWGDVIVAKGIPPGSIKPTGDDHQLWIILVCEGVWGCGCEAVGVLGCVRVWVCRWRE